MALIIGGVSMLVAGLLSLLVDDKDDILVWPRPDAQKTISSSVLSKLFITNLILYQGWKK
jgi:hypothetical protein